MPVPRCPRYLLRLTAVPLWPWCLAFVLMCVAVWHDGGRNAASRFAMLRAMSTHCTFQINRYLDWTADWARTPDGRCYSNKAPGAALVAFPATWLADRVLFAWNPELRRTEPPLGYKTAVSVLFQVLPFSLAVLLAGQALCRRGASHAALAFAGLSMLFANTASLFMNSYFGHGLTAWLLLGLALALIADRPALVGAFFGFALLSDYAVGMLTLPLLVGFFARRETWSQRWRRSLYLTAGAAAPAALWVWYHTVCFGGPFTIALVYQNPVFQSEGVARGGLQAVWSVKPHWDVLWQLLFGASRGLLATQPWALVVYALLALQVLRRHAAHLPASLTILTLTGLPLLLWSNAGFSGWHGGWSAGPRYLSPILPLLGFCGALLYDRLGAWPRLLLWLSLIPAVVLRVLIYAGPSPYMRGLSPIWETYWQYLVLDPQRVGAARVAFLVGLLLLAAWQANRLRLRDEPPAPLSPTEHP